MAIGDQSDLFVRIKSLLPPWFGDNTPILDALINALAFQLAFIYSLIAYTKAQMRLLTASDGFLDTWAYDFFGTLIQRKTGQSDTSWRNTIIANLFREKGTRNAMQLILTQLTGFTPIIFEPTFPQSQQTGGYGIACGYSVAGGYASLAFPYQTFVTATIPSDGSVLEADVFTAAESVRPEGVNVWIRITGIEE
jgi:hypothetical protein